MIATPQWRQKLAANQLKTQLAIIAMLFASMPVLAAERQSQSRSSSRQSSQRSQQNESRHERHQQTGFEVQLTKIRAIDASNQTPGGETGAEQIRISPADYPGDGSGETIITDLDRTNARTISNTIVRQDSDIPSRRGLSNMIWAWGQFLDHDIDLTLTDAANGFANIAIEDENDPLGPNPIFFDRSDFADGSGTSGNPRTQLNSITSYIDASNVYGSDDVRATLLREFVGGKLRVSEGDLPPVNDVGLPNAGPPGGFLVGDVRGNENVVLTSMHTLFVREHNRLCALIQLLDPAADDEAVYQLARKIVQAEMQRITYREFLPALLGEEVKNQAIASRSDPGVATEFATASYRFGHSTLSTNIEMVDGDSLSTITLTNAFFNPSFLTDNPSRVDQLLAGLPTHSCQEIDTKVVSDLQTFLFGPPGAGGFDLAALNIQRGRDHGLADYNSMRAAYGLSRVTDFSEMTSDSNLQADLEELYGSVDNIDAWIGGLAEDHVSGGSVGPLIRAVLMDQFSRLRSADEFYHRNDRDLKSPIVEAVVDLENQNLYQSVLANTTIRQYSESPFFAGADLQSDIRATYNEKTDRLHIIGNHEDNTILLIDSGVGITLVAGGDSKVNGESSVTIATGKQPNLTIDFGKGDDSVLMIGVNFKQAVISLGDEKETLRRIFSRSDSLITDVELDEHGPRLSQRRQEPQPRIQRNDRRR